MLLPSSTWTPFGLLILGVKGSFGEAHRPHSSYPNEPTIHDPRCTSNVTVIDTTTIISSTIVPTTHYVDVTVPHYVNVTVSSTKTSTVSTCITESTTTTLHYTVSITETDSATITNTRTTTETDSTTTTETESTTTTETDSTTTTETDSATVTNTQTTTATVPATITTYTTQTVISTTVDPCPTTCSISAGTVNLFFWPTDRPYTYPSTYVDSSLAYTFTSPSVYMLIPTARGTNSLGPAGPSTTSWILALDLDEVSTIFDGSVTRQLTLSDLGTDCAQTADPSAIATMVDSRCDPVLAAPKQVSSWAYPCNACGRFGLFDPPYAIPTLTGSLIETTTQAPPPVTVTTTAAPDPTSTPPVGTVLVIYYVDGTAVATSTSLTTGISGTLTSSVFVSLTGITSSSSEVVSSPGSATTASSEIVSTLDSATTTSPLLPTATSTASPSTSPTSVVTGSATRVTGGLAWLISSVFLAALLL
ncbi:hypothetical protein QBC33DRAFT_548754 [Phialemonium atrogriseum]|uniref:Uncharacterized protein n=1 Tax=Phialemonium atrogriseum TaxID=1093897 RepID=A0AAJ0FCR2_9PEZI|nr:uncharacterized protein QBC33DRAFT_548754 [Phialemonium atrogriseum]KAK1763856.1 hypothetical protein QBC33DRAFT_548754 [Phialemonium atrogriseum]